MFLTRVVSELYISYAHWEASYFYHKCLMGAQAQVPICVAGRWRFPDDPRVVSVIFTYSYSDSDFFAHDYF